MGVAGGGVTEKAVVTVHSGQHCVQANTVQGSEMWRDEGGGPECGSTSDPPSLQGAPDPEVTSSPALGLHPDGLWVPTAQTHQGQDKARRLRGEPLHLHGDV